MLKSCMLGMKAPVTSPVSTSRKEALLHVCNGLGLRKRRWADFKSDKGVQGRHGVRLCSFGIHHSLSNLPLA